MKNKQKIILCLIFSTLIGLFANIPLFGDHDHDHDHSVIEAQAASYDCEYCGGSGRRTCPQNGGYTYNAGGVCCQWGCYTCLTSGKVPGESKDYDCYVCGGDNPQWISYFITVPCPTQGKCPRCGSGQYAIGCPYCDGDGRCKDCIAPGSGSHEVRAACPHCGTVGGKGQYIGTDKECTNCGGVGYVYCFECNICGICDDSIEHIRHSSVECEECKYIEPEKITETYTVTVIASPASGGTAGGGGVFEYGATCTVWASPNEGYSSSGTKTFPVTSDTTVTVTFTKIAPPTPIPTGVTPIPYPDAIVIPPLSPSPIPEPVPRPFVIAGPIVPPTSANPPYVSPISDTHEDRCYVGEKHICSSGYPCYSPNYSHTSDCWGIVSWKTCTSCGGQNNCGHYSSCSSCKGYGTDYQTCGACGGSGNLTCNLCGGSGSRGQACSCGTGRISCSKCSGVGRLNCSKCSGVGRLDCSKCSGGRIPCSSCNGVGTKKTSCSSCGGTGHPTCSTCGGTGRYNGKSCPGCAQAAQAMCSSCRGTGKITSDCPSCAGGTLDCPSCDASKGGTIDCPSCAGGTLDCPSCVGGTIACSVCGGDGIKSISCPKTVPCTACGGIGEFEVSCGTCSGTGRIWSPCSTCGQSGKLPVEGWRCGSPGGCYVSSWTRTCTKVSGAYYLGSTRVYPVCHEIVTNLSPLYPNQTLQISESPNQRVYATFLSSEGKHGDQPQKVVTATMSNYNSNLVNTSQSITLSYGKYNKTAKNNAPATTTASIYKAGNVVVTFNGNGGTLSPFSQKTVTYGGTYGSLPVATKNGAPNYAWLNENNEEVVPSSIVKYGKNHTLTAAFPSSTTQTVTFDANKGTVSPQTKVVLFGQPYGALPTPVYTGHTFVDWRYGSEITTATTVVSAYGNHTLKAGWTPNNYTITLNPTTGTCVTKTVGVRYASEANRVLPNVGASKTGYHLLGWYSAPSGGEKVFYADGTYCSGSYWQSGKWYYPNNLTVYAQWAPNTYTVTLDGMGATSLPQTSVRVTYDALVPNILLPTRTGYALSGFYTAKDGVGAKIYNKGTGIAIWKTPKDTTIYANWTPISYAINVMKDEFRISREVAKTVSVNYDEVYTVPSALANKEVHLTYNFMSEKTGSSSPQGTIKENQKTAVITFRGWQAYLAPQYTFLRAYAPLQKISNLTKEAGTIIALFPQWGDASESITLPLLTAKGYTHLGWHETSNNANLAQLYPPNAKYRPPKDQTLYAYWTPNISYVNLDDRGATGKGHTLMVRVTYDTMGEDIVVPKKEGYLFGGYYTEPHANGTRYYDHAGHCTRVWRETQNVLYAYWVQAPVVLPEEKPIPTVTPAPVQPPVSIKLEKNPTATVSSPNYNVSLGVPSTEEVTITTTVGNYVFDGLLRNRTGTAMMKLWVNVPYLSVYEDINTEELHYSEITWLAVQIEVPRAYSYWYVAKGETKLASEVTLTASYLKKSGSVNFTQTLGECTTKIYTQSEHISSSSAEVTLSEKTPFVILSTTPGVAPSLAYITSILERYAKNTAYELQAQLSVKSDRLVVDGNVLLSDEVCLSGVGKAPGSTNHIVIPTQTKSTTAQINPTAGNGNYQNLSETISYEVHYRIAEERAYAVKAPLIIHTPVVSSPTKITETNPNGTLRHTYSEQIAKDAPFAITIDESVEFLTMDVSDLLHGSHNRIEGTTFPGYGTRDYSTSLAGNQMFDSIILCSTVPLHFDTNKDSIIASSNKSEWKNTSDDFDFSKNEIIRITRESGRWFLNQGERKAQITLGNISIYVLATECNSDFQVTYGVLAANGMSKIASYSSLFSNGSPRVGASSVSERSANNSLYSYFAYDTIDYPVNYKFVTFRWYGTEESLAKVSSEETTVVTKQGYEAYFYVTQFGGFDGTVKVTPSFSLVDKDGNLIEDDVLVFYSDNRNGRRYDYLLPSEDTSVKNFRTKWLNIPVISETIDEEAHKETETVASSPELCQTWTLNEVEVLEGGLAPHTVYGAVIEARHGSYRLPNNIKVLQRSLIPKTTHFTKEQFLTDYVLRDSVLKSDLEVDYATEGYLKVSLDVCITFADGTPLIEYGSLPTISLYYTLGEESDGLYFQYNGVPQRGNGIDDDMYVESVHVN